MPVGIVLVSHSAGVARGAAALAREMAGAVAVEPAGGLDEPGEPFGTDAVRIAAAIDRADGGAGVLVLTDLGSAVLSAETAVELLDRDVEVRLTAAPLVEGAVAAAVAARAGGDLAAVAAEAEAGLAAKQAHLAPPDSGTGVGVGVATASEHGMEPQARAEVEVTPVHGLHGRPAARLVRTAAGYDATVTVRDLTTGAGPVAAGSLSAVMTLGVNAGHRLEVVASGPDAAAAVAAIRDLAAADFGDPPPTGPGPAADAARGPDPGGTDGRLGDGPNDAEGTVLPGLPAAPGSAYGPVIRRATVGAGDPDADRGDAEDERLRAAVARVHADLDAARTAAAALGPAGRETADVLDVQGLLLDDDALLGAGLAATRAGDAAGAAWRAATGALAGRYAAAEDAYVRARAEDVEDLGRRVLAALAAPGSVASAEPGPRPDPDARADATGEPGVLVADLLGPADTAGLDRARVAAVLTARGSPTGHAAIVARALGLPAVVGAGPAVLVLPEGSRILVDGDGGTAYVEPPPALRDWYERRRVATARVREAAERAAGEPAVTLDGVRVEVEVNVGSPADAAAAPGADGVGLLRTEFLFHDRDRAPAEDEQVAAYEAVAVALPGRPVTVRTLDAGADKPVPYLAQRPEDNPFLGVRGLRLGLARPALLATQLRAVLRAAARHPLRVLAPMVTTAAELAAFRAAVRDARAELAAAGVAAGDAVSVGVMVEVPAAALLADRLLAEADFASIGTNDLTQYVLAAERGNPDLAGLGDDRHPAVLALVDRVVRAGAAARTPVAVCGELAADPAATALLVGLGLTRLSVTPPAVPLVKHAVRAVRREDAGRLAAAALAATSSAEVAALLAADRR